MPRLRRIPLRAIALTISLGASVLPSHAQTTPAGSPRWEIEVHGGLSVARLPAGGTTTVPPAGAAIPTSSPIFPSREVPSWFFGDGASLINGVNAEFEAPARVTPLENAFGLLGRDRTAGAAFGARLRRTIGPRLWAEFGLDVTTGQASLTSDFLSAIETTRASYEAAFNGLLATGPFTDVLVVATAITSQGSRRDIALTGAVNWSMGPRGGFEPYLTAGGGVITGTGSSPSVALDGRYSFSILSLVPIEERDRVTVRFEHDTAPVAVLGAGLRRTMSDRWGFAIDGRVSIGRNGIGVGVDAEPSVTARAPAGFIESFTTPAIQFANDPSTGRRSTLTAPAVQGFTAFKGEGLQTRVQITIGVFRRF